MHITILNKHTTLFCKGITPDSAASQKHVAPRAKGAKAWYSFIIHFIISLYSFYYIYTFISPYKGQHPQALPPAGFIGQLLEANCDADAPPAGYTHNR